MGFLKLRSVSVLGWVLVAILAGCARDSQLPVFKPLKEIPTALLSEKVRSGEVASLVVPGESRHPIQFEKPAFQRLRGGQYLAKYSQGQTLSQFNRPRVPMLKYSFSVGSTVQAELSLVRPQLEATDQAIELARAEKPLVWGKKSFEISDSRPGTYFPGKLFEAHQEGNVVYVTVFPLQVEMATGRVLTLVAGSWSLRLQPKKPTTWSATGAAPAVILTSKKLLGSAQELQAFHAEKTGVKSDIETVEAIAEKEEPIALEELPDGYKSSELFDGIVKKWDSEKGTGYHFENARKIISYLKKRADQNPQFKYVVILGNSELVPPSYYFLQEETLGPPRTGVTDQCYSAGPLCLEPRLAVGRLPFRNEKEVAGYLKKARRWFENRAQVTSELSLYGGKAFKSSPFYIGELGTLVTVNHEKSDWHQVKKYFQTEGNFTKETIKKLVSNENQSRLVYYLDHGMGNRWYAGDEYLNSFEIAAMEPAPQSVPPVIVSVSCMNGAFDEHLLVDDAVIEDSGKYGVASVGTSLLRSQAGALAYIGGARDGLGSPETEVDERGNVEVLGTSYGLQVFDGFVEAYRNNSADRLGDVLIQTLSQYAFKSGNDMTDINHRWTYWITELLGDPLMPVERGTKEVRAYSAAKSEFDFFDTTSGFPRLEMDAKREELSQFPVGDVGGPVVAKVYQLKLSEDGFSGEELIKTEHLEDVKSAVVRLDTDKGLQPGQQYLIKLINKEGVPRENHIVFSTKN